MGLRLASSRLRHSRDLGDSLALDDHHVHHNGVGGGGGGGGGGRKSGAGRSHPVRLLRSRTLSDNGGELEDGGWRSQGAARPVSNGVRLGSLRGKLC